MKKQVSTFLLLLLVLVLVSDHSSAQSPLAANTNNTQAQRQYVDLSLNVDRDAIVAGEDFNLAIIQTIEPQWHTYWKNPGDSGEATTFEIILPDGFSKQEVQWPAPKRMPYATLMNFGYEDQAVFFTQISPPENINVDSVTITVKSRWLVCKDICIPERGEAEITVAVQSSSTPTQDGFFAEHFAKIPQRVSDHVITYDYNNENITFAFSNAFLNQNQQPLSLFLEEWGLFENPAPQEFLATESGYKLTLPLGLRDINALEDHFAAVITTTGNNTQPQAYELSVFKSDVSISPAVTDGLGSNENIENFADGNFWLHIVLALLGGLILNLMPCVFPVLSLKALGLMQMSGHARRHAIEHGFAYTGGILASFAVFAAIILSFRAGGEALGWGFHLQNPINIFWLTAIMFLIGLNLSGFFIVQGKFINWGSLWAQSESTFGSFMTGVLAALVATPCTAPFMAGAIAYAALQPPIQSLIIFLSVGLGLALPYLLLTLSPRLQAKMPKPGAWMERFKEFLAFPMYLTALWLLWVLSLQGGIEALFITLFALISITFILWLLKNKSGIFVIVSLAIVLLMTSYTLSAKQSADISTQITSVNTIGYTPSTLTDALETGQPVFVNMTAAWCITCKVNERTTLNTARGQAQFERIKALQITGDWTNEDPDITAYLNRYNRNGVPLYVFYPAADETGTRPDAQILPQILTPQILEDALSK